MPKILVIDDEKHIVELLKFNLELKGYEVCYSFNGVEGFEKVKKDSPDLIILDWMLPNISGIDLLEKIREDMEISKIPVIMLTAKNMEEDKISGLDKGADDYITKPFSVKELLARIKTVLRRYNISANSENIISVGDVKLDLEKHEVTVSDKVVDLTLKEFELLKLLMKNRGKVLTRDYLLDKIWGYEYFGETRTVDVHIRYLRKKIEDESDAKYIETIRGVGYKMK